jgi:uncharacterized membrane protein YebE (DUF533 family)
MRAEELLNAFVGANAQPGTEHTDVGRQRGFLEEAFGAFGQRDDARSAGLGGLLGGGLFGDRSGFSGGLGDMLGQVGQMFGRNPGLTGGALGGIAGLLLGSRSGSGLMGGLVRMGGLGLIGSLAYKAFRRWQERKQGEAGAVVDREAMHPANATDAHAELYLRAMIAAIASDGKMDDGERARVGDGLKRAGVDDEGAQWITQEFAKPATVEELASRARTPEEATKIYTAARVAIDPDTEQERQFLDGLAAALKLDPQLRIEIDKSTTEVKVNA